MRRRLLVAVLAAGAFLALPAAAPAVSTTLVINEVDYDQPSTDTAEFLELKNVSGAAIDLASVSLAAGDHYVICANLANTANCDLDVSPDTNLIQNGAPDAIALRRDGTLIDALSYAGNSA